MDNILRAPEECNRAPLGYFDVVGCWFMRPNDEKRVAWFNTQCGHPLINRGDLRLRNDAPARFDTRYRQYLRFLQPSRELLEDLLDRGVDDVRITYLEPAVNYPGTQLSEALADGFVQKWNNGRRGAETYSAGNRRSGKRDLGTNFQYYNTRSCKLTGQ
jgi:hypothetical protein